MNYQDRIELRDYIIERFLELKLLKRFRDKYSINSSIISFKDRLTKIDDELKVQYTKYINEFRNEEEAIYCITHIDDIDNHRCLVCKKPAIFYTKHNRYRKTCGDNKCYMDSIHTEEVLKKAQDTTYKNFGVRHPAQNKKIHEKMEVTLYGNYGVRTPLKNKDIKEKVEQTTLNHHKKRMDTPCFSYGEEMRTPFLYFVFVYIVYF